MTDYGGGGGMEPKCLRSPRSEKGLNWGWGLASEADVPGGEAETATGPHALPLL